jgi:hypothetical protein
MIRTRSLFKDKEDPRGAERREESSGKSDKSSNKGDMRRCSSRAPLMRGREANGFVDR